MCRSHSSYSIRSNLVNWFFAFLTVATLQWLAYLSFDKDNPDQFAQIWAAGAGWGILFYWAISILHRRVESLTSSK